MPADPDNSKIEELVKGYAAKRREQAGGSFEMHPATRKMLQGEIVRQRPPAPPRETGLIGLVLRFWPRLVFASAMVAVLSLVLWNVSQHPNPSESSEKLAKASDDDLKRSKDADGEGIINEKLAAGENSPAARPLFRNVQPAPTRRGEKEAEVRLRLDVDLTKKEEASVPASTEEFKERANKPAAQPSVSFGSEIQKRGDLKKDGSIRDSYEVDGFAVGQQTRETPANNRKLSVAKSLDGEAKNGVDANADHSGIAGSGIAPGTPPQKSPSPASPSSPRYSELTENRAYSRVETAPKIVQAPPQERSSLSVADRPVLPSSTLAGGAADPRPAGGFSQSGLKQVDEQALAFNKPSPVSGPASEPKPVGQAGGAGLAYDKARELSLGERASSTVFYGLNPTNSAAPATTAPAPTTFTSIAPPAVDSVSAALGVKTTESLGRNAGFGDQYFGYALGARVIRSRFANVARQSKLDDAITDTSPLDRKPNALNESVTTSQPLASTFDVEQSGDRIRIIDSDGSTYLGTILVTGSENNKGALQKPEPARLSDQDGLLSIKVGDLSQTAFTASGTNRLGKTVVIKLLGDLRDTGSPGGAPTTDKAQGVVPEGVLRGRGATAGGNLSKAFSPSASSSPTDSEKAGKLVRAGRIQGTVQVGQTNVVRFDAVRVSP